MSSGYIGSYTPPVRQVLVQGQLVTLTEALTELGALDAELGRLAAELRAFGGRTAAAPTRTVLPGSEASDQEVADAVVRLRTEVTGVRERSARVRADAIGQRLARGLGTASPVQGVRADTGNRGDSGLRPAAQTETNTRVLEECRALVRKEVARIDEADAEDLAARLSRMEAGTATATTADFGRAQVELRVCLHEAIVRRDARRARIAAGERLAARAALAPEDERESLLGAVRGSDDPRTLAPRVEQAVARAEAERGRLHTARQIASALRAIDCDVHEQTADVLADTGEVVVPLNTAAAGSTGYGIRVRLLEDRPDLSAKVVDLAPARSATDKPGSDHTIQQWFCQERARTLRAHLEPLSWYPRSEQAPGRYPAVTAAPTFFDRSDPTAPTRADEEARRAEEERRSRHQEQARQRRRPE